MSIRLRRTIRKNRDRHRIARGARFAAIAWLLRRYGEPIRDFIEKRLTLIAACAAAVIVLLYFGARYFLRSVV